MTRLTNPILPILAAAQVILATTAPYAAAEGVGPASGLVLGTQVVYPKCDGKILKKTKKVFVCQKSYELDYPWGSEPGILIPAIVINPKDCKPNSYWNDGPHYKHIGADKGDMEYLYTITCKRK